MLEKDGLNYVPRERTTDGRVFEHACDCKVLISHLNNQKETYEQPMSAARTPPIHKEDVCYFVQIVDESPAPKDN